MKTDITRPQHFPSIAQCGLLSVMLVYELLLRLCSAALTAVTFTIIIDINMKDRHYPKLENQ